MAKELEKLLNGDENTDATQPPLEDKQPEDKTEGGDAPAAKDPEIVKKEEHLANLEKAISEAEGELTDIRKAKAKEKSGAAPDADEDLPNIDASIEADPAAKAFDRRQDKKIQPIKDELEKEKAEVRAFALREFLDANIALARDPNKIKELMQYYERIRTASERTREGVLLDLRKAAAVVFHEDILNAAQGRRTEEARADAAFAAPAVGGGSTSYRTPKDVSERKLSEEEKAMLARWGISPDEWLADHKKYANK